MLGDIKARSHSRGHVMLLHRPWVDAIIRKPVSCHTPQARVPFMSFCSVFLARALSSSSAT